MPFLNRINQYLSGQSARVIVVLFVSVGVGFWLQYRLTLHAVETSAIEEAQALLKRDADKHLQAFELEPSPDDADSDHETYASLLENIGEHQTTVAVVDSDWRILDLRDMNSGAAHTLMTGSKLVVEPFDESLLRTETYAPGTVAVGGTTYLSLIHQPERVPFRIMWLIPENAAYRGYSALMGILPVTGLVAGLWIASMLTFGYFFLIHRSKRQSSPKSVLSTEQLRQAQDLIRARDAVIFGLAKLADSRDPDTGDHLERICLYSTILAEAMRSDARYSNVITPSYIKLLGTCAALHDIGKVGIEDDILRKPGPLTDDERCQMKDHTLIGGECIKEISQRLGQSNFLHMAFEIAMSHHEWWDGNGYPIGLAGEDIPLSARIVAIADVYDALSMQRVYKEAYTHEECVEMITALRGSQFDPSIIDLWLTVHPEFEAISKVAYRAPRTKASHPMELAKV